MKTVGLNPIYMCQGKYYVGVESLDGMDEEVENCIDCDSLEEAEKICSELPQPSDGI